MSDPTVRLDFIRQRVHDDVAAGASGGKVVTRFPPEPNGHLHIGHAKSICLNFGVAEEFKGVCYMRFDDTNPEKERKEYVEAILNDVHWLGFDWSDRQTHASDYFEQLYGFAVDLIRQGLAYVDSLSGEAIREYRGTLTEPGRDSPDRNRPVAENMDLFTRMREGEFANGEYVLRAKIDMASGNINMRDPVIYRILHKPHPVAGDRWCIYPMYDFTHCLSDALEGVTHSLCTLEFEDHRPLYNWFIDQLETPCQPQQIEFSRLNLGHTVVSKRVLNRLVTEGYVDGWDDPRMPTLSGLRRRGYSPAAIREFCKRIGISKSDNNVELGMLEHCIRDDLDHNAPRVMGVLEPLKVVIENYPADQVEWFDAANHPARPELGSRKIPFSREIYIERADFMEEAPRKFFRLSPGREVRLRYAYYITCQELVRDPESGEVIEVRCSYDPQSRGGGTADGRKVKGTLHWVSIAHALNACVRQYQNLFTVEYPNAQQRDKELHSIINPEALQVLEDCQVEPGLKDALPESRFQFERQGYFCVDSRDSTPDRPVFNRTVSLRDSWARKGGK